MDSRTASWKAAWQSALKHLKAAGALGCKSPAPSDFPNNLKWKGMEGGAFLPRAVYLNKTTESDPVVRDDSIS